MAMQTATAEQTARDFFSRYNEQNIPAMIELFTDAGIVEYVPLHLEGPVGEIGPGSWGVLVDAFPDLHNEIGQITVSENGKRAFVDVMIGGKQVKDTFGITNQNKTYWLRHLFVFDFDAVGKIERVTSFWDSVDWYSQLGKTSIN
jgi:SnoaL-like domain